MLEKTTEKLIDFNHPFSIGALVTPLEAGTYRLTVDEELIEGLSFPAYRTVASHLEIPAVGHSLGRSQYLQVTVDEIEEALKADAEKGIPALS